MRKVIWQGLLLVLLFTGSWWMLSQVSWVSLFRIPAISRNAEEKLGELLVDVFQQEEGAIENPVALAAVDSIVNKICLANKLNRSAIKIHLLKTKEVNAFALPDSHLVIYAGLINDAKNPDEVAGVIAHEIAHIQLNHVTQKLLKEMGVSALFTLVAGSGNGTLLKELAKTVSATAFDRALEKEADEKAVDYLITATVNPAPLGDFLLRLSKQENAVMKYFTWISTHPDSEERAAAILKKSRKNKSDYKPSLSQEDWSALCKSVAE